MGLHPHLTLACSLSVVVFSFFFFVFNFLSWKTSPLLHASVIPENRGQFPLEKTQQMAEATMII